MIVQGILQRAFLVSNWHTDFPMLRDTTHIQWNFFFNCDFIQFNVTKFKVIYLLNTNDYNNNISMKYWWEYYKEYSASCAFFNMIDKFSFFFNMIRLIYTICVVLNSPFLLLVSFKYTIRFIVKVHGTCVWYFYSVSFGFIYFLQSNSIKNSHEIL